MFRAESQMLPDSFKKKTKEKKKQLFQRREHEARGALNPPSQAPRRVCLRVKSR